MRTNTRSNGLLTDVEMYRAWKIAGFEIGRQSLLNLADEEHRPEERKLFRCGQIDGCHSVTASELSRLLRTCQSSDYALPSIAN